MASFGAGVVVGRRVKCLGSQGQVTVVDEPRQLVTVRMDNAKPGEVDPVVGIAEVELLEADSTVVPAPAKQPEKSKNPTKAQITAAREKARVLGTAEGLKGAKLEDVQDEAEAELVARMGRGEAA